MNNKNYALLERIGQTLHTRNHWKKPLERQLGIREGRIDDWQRAEEKRPDFKIREGIWRDLLALLKQHQQDNQSLIKELDDLLRELE